MLRRCWLLVLLLLLLMLGRCNLLDDYGLLIATLGVRNSNLNSAVGARVNMLVDSVNVERHPEQAATD